MYAYMRKVWEFLQKNAKNILIFGGIIIILLCIYWLLFGKYVSDNGEPVDEIRSEFDRATDAKQDIANTASGVAKTSSDIATAVGNLAESIDNASGASERFDQILGECQSIIEQVRSQPAKGLYRRVWTGK